MNPAERHQRVGELFDAVCDLPDDAAAELLAQLCPDASIRAEVLQMVRADRTSAGLIDSHAAHGLLHPSPDPTPEHVGPYRITGTLGRGGMGVVYEAEQSHPRRRVALKVLHPWLRAANADLFRFEAQAMGSLLHPGIPQVYEAGADGALTWLVMELVRGEPLLRWASGVDRRARLAALAKICDAVQHAHDAGIVHRDLKPSNVLVTSEGQPKVLDFGVATPAGEASLAGTPAYMSPEHLRGAAVGPRSDVYALGVIGWELLTGGLPTEPLPEIPALRGHLRRILAASLAPDPSDRTPSCAALAHQLRRYLEHRPLPGVGFAPAYRTRLWLRRNRAISLAITAAILVIVALGVGRWGLDTWREAERERAGAASLQVATAEIERLIGEDDWREAQRIFEAWLRVPEHRGTAAMAQAWRQHAHHLAAHGERAEALIGLAQAWVLAVDDQTELATAKDLLAHFAEDGRWLPLLRLVEQLPPPQRDALRDLEYTAAVAVRDTARAATLRPEEGPNPRLTRALSRGTPLPYEAAADVRDIDGDGDLDLVLVDASANLTLFADATDPWQTWGRIPHPSADTWVHSDRVLTLGDALVLVATTRSATPHTHVYRAVWDRSVSPWEGRWKPVATLPSGAPLSAAVLDSGAGPELYVGLAYPRRGLARVGPPPGWEIAAPIPEIDALDSDVTTVSGADLDGDGTEELIVTVGAWSAYDLRVYARDSDGWVLRGLRRLGSVRRLLVLPGTPSPQLLAFKSDTDPSAEQFGREHPYGEPAGLYWLSSRPGLDPLGFAAPPLRAPGRGRVLPGGVTGDFDGDGTVDLAAALADDDRHHAWILPGAAAPGPGFLIAGLAPMGAFDADGDGDDELLAQQDEGRLWVLGAGTTPLSPWTAPEQVTPDPAPAPAGEASFQRAWSRAMSLLQAGLTEQAAGALVELGRLQGPSPPAGHAFAAAASLYESTGAIHRAADLFARAHRRLPADRTALAGLARTAAAALDLTTASAAWDELEAAASIARPEWIRAGAAFDEPIDLTAELTRWTSPHPHAVRATDDGWRIQVFNDAGPVLTRPIAASPDRLGFEVDLDLEILELGASVAIRARDRQGNITLGLEIHPFGGGGITEVILRCEGDHGQPLGLEEWTAGTAPTHLEVRVEQLGGEVVCTSVRDGGERRWRRQLQRRTALPPEHTLSIEASNQPIYNPPMVTALRIHRLEARGILHGPAPGPTPDHAMMRGDFGHPGLDDAWAHLALGDSRQTRAALGTLVADDDRQTLRWMLRTHPQTASAVLHDALHDGFFELFHDAWYEATRHYLWRPDVRDALRVVQLDGLTGATPAQQALLLARAQVFLEDGQRARAEQQAQLALDSPGATPEVTGRARLILAQALLDTDPARAAHEVHTYITSSPTPSLARERVLRTGRLADLFP